MLLSTGRTAQPSTARTDDVAYVKV